MGMSTAGGLGFGVLFPVHGVDAGRDHAGEGRLARAGNAGHADDDPATGISGLKNIYGERDAG